MTDNETIVAIATPPGTGGVGIIRLSGSLSLNIAASITHKSDLKPRLASYCSFYDLTDELIDYGLCLYFPSPNSFTGEDVVEFQCHGSPVVLDLIIQECTKLGARLANHGEFSERAFLNNKLDLTQAEAIADLINANSRTVARMALRSLQGEFSKKISVINDKLVQLRVYIEAAIDFTDEEIDFLKDGKVLEKLSTISTELEELCQQSSNSINFKEGFCVVILGAPNAGKSTLINTLVARDIAIVTDIPGTTRDVLSEVIFIDNMPVKIIDTAGIRETGCQIEQEGVKRAWNEIEKADCILRVRDIRDDNKEDLILEQRVSELTNNVPVIDVFNKIDLVGISTKKDKHSVYLSAKMQQGIDLLKDMIKSAVQYKPTESNFLARRRHLVALEQAYTHIQRAISHFKASYATELLAQDLRDIHHILGEITGEFSNDDLLGKIFSSFCIGK